MRIRLSACIAAGLVSIAVPSCNLTTSSPPDQNITEFCADWAKAICQIGNGASTFDVTPCAAYQTGVCTSFVGNQQGGTRTYTQANGAACIQALNDIYSGSPTSISVMSLLNTDTICGRVVAGDQSTNEACTSDSDCASNLVCAPTAIGATTEVCAPSTATSLGDFCGDPGDVCQSDSYCAVQSNGEALCIATPALGAACSASVPCGSTATCSPLGECVPAGAIGSACTSNADCASGYCDPYADVCTNGLSFALGSDDCKGIEGASTGTPDAGSSDASAPQGD
jgi:hypothetical protein